MWIKGAVYESVLLWMGEKARERPDWEAKRGGGRGKERCSFFNK